MKTDMRASRLVHSAHNASRLVSNLLFSCMFLSLVTLLPAVSSAQVDQSSVEELVKQLSSSEVDAQRDAAYELVRRRETSPAVIEAFGKALSDDDTQVRFQSLLGLARAGSRAEPVIQQLLDCLDDRGDQVRYRAADALGKIGKAAIKPLRDAWEAASSQTRVEIARAFSIMGREAGDLGGFLLKSLTEDSPDVRRYGAEAIVAVEPDNTTALLQLADHADSQVRKIGIVALAALAEPSEQVSQRLQSAAADEDAKVREIAIIALAKSPLSSEQKAEFIDRALVDAEASVRSAAIAALRKAGLSDASFAARIAEQMQQVSPEVGNSLVKALAEIGPGARVALPQLLSESASSSLDADLLAKTIAGFGPSVVAELLAVLETRPELETLVASSLAIIGEPAVDDLLGGMSSENQTIRKSSIRALGGIRPTRREWLEKIVQATGDIVAEVREVSIASLIAAGENAEFAKESILTGTSDEDAKVRAAAFTGLSAFDFPSDELRTVFYRGLEDTSPAVRMSCLAAMADIDGAADRNLEDVIELVSDEDTEVRRAALMTLAKIKLDSIAEQQREKLNAAIVSALKDPQSPVRTQATTTVTELGLADQAVLAALADNLTDDLDLLQATLLALAKVGTRAESLAPTVSQLMDHPSEPIRVAAVKTYAAIQPDRAVLTGRLTETLSDSKWSVRQAAGESLGSLGPDAKAAVPTLFRLLSSEEDSDFARGAIREIDAAPIEVLPLLLESLDSEDRRLGYYSIFLLGKIGPPAAEALPRLEAKLAESGGERRSDFRSRYLIQAIASIKGEKVEDDR